MKHISFLLAVCTATALTSACSSKPEPQPPTEESAYAAYRADLRKQIESEVQEFTVAEENQKIQFSSPVAQEIFLSMPIHKTVKKAKGGSVLVYETPDKTQTKTFTMRPDGKLKLETKEESGTRTVILDGGRIFVQDGDGAFTESQDPKLLHAMTLTHALATNPAAIPEKLSINSQNMQDFITGEIYEEPIQIRMDSRGAYVLNIVPKATYFAAPQVRLFVTADTRHIMGIDIPENPEFSYRAAALLQKDGTSLQTKRFYNGTRFNLADSKINADIPDSAFAH